VNLPTSEQFIDDLAREADAPWYSRRVPPVVLDLYAKIIVFYLAVWTLVESLLRKTLSLPSTLGFLVAVILADRSFWRTVEKFLDRHGV
jgi:hypothetical protein